MAEETITDKEAKEILHQPGEPAGMLDFIFPHIPQVSSPSQETSKETQQPAGIPDMLLGLGGFTQKHLAGGKYDHDQSSHGRRGAAAGGGGKGGKGEEAAGGGKFAGKKANPDGVDTQAQYMNADGTWTKERQALHKKILDHFYEGKTPVENPTAYVMGGGPAAGKSTMIRQGKVDIPDNHVLANADEIKAMLPEYEGGKNAAFVHEESSYLSKVLAYGAAKSKYNVVLDGTGDGSMPGLTKKVESLRAGGQKVVGRYVTVDVDEAWSRVLAREKKTGRGVPEAVVRGTHMNVAKMFPQILASKMFDSVELYESGGELRLIASGDRNGFTIHNQDLWDAFLARGG